MEYFHKKLDAAENNEWVVFRDIDMDERIAVCTMADHLGRLRHARPLFSITPRCVAVQFGAINMRGPSLRPHPFLVWARSMEPLRMFELQHAWVDGTVRVYQQKLRLKFGRTVSLDFQARMGVIKKIDPWVMEAEARMLAGRPPGVLA